MASLLSSHLEQISLCAASIAELPFPGPRIFTNALLGQPEITSLIRDTESYERALFHLAAPPIPGKSTGPDAVTGTSHAAPTGAARRQTMYGNNRQPKNKAVAAVLGGDLYQQTRRETTVTRQRGEVDVEVLLEGAEKLAAVYPIPGATEKIAQLRNRHQMLMENIRHYEARVELQSQELQKLSGPSDIMDDEDDDRMDEPAQEPAVSNFAMTREDLEREEAEIRALEEKKKALEERVTGMERDLGGLMR